MIGKEVPIDAEKAAGRSKAQQIRDLTDYQRAADEAAKVMYFTSRGFQSQTFAGQQLEIRRPGGFITSGGMATMG